MMFMHVTKSDLELKSSKSYLSQLIVTKKPYVYLKKMIAYRGE